jgi:2-keto-4-pentenoate hydratase/2-oxohepta-3-ene-1,7-dioic acid hydratase in catechol pathway
MLTMAIDKVICVGKNYLKHALELGDKVPEEPVYFLKPASTILAVQGSGTKAQLPANFEVHHELELVFEIRRAGTAWRLSRYTLGLDLTLRELQNRLKKEGQPWERAKVFKNSSILGPWREISSLEKVLEAPFSLEINGQVRQQGAGKDMRWGPEFLIEDLPKWFPLEDGDIIFTGTPEGVGPLKEGDSIRIRGLDLDFQLSC